MEIILWTSLGLLYAYCCSHKAISQTKCAYKSLWVRISDRSLMEIKLSSPVLFLLGFSYKASTASLSFLCLSSLMFSALHLVNCKSRDCRLQDFDNLCYFALKISGPPDHFYYFLLLLSLHVPLVCPFLHPFPTTATAWRYDKIILLSEKSGKTTFWDCH